MAMNEARTVETRHRYTVVGDFRARSTRGIARVPPPSGRAGALPADGGGRTPVLSPQSSNCSLAGATGK